MQQGLSCRCFIANTREFFLGGRGFLGTYGMIVTAESERKEFWGRYKTADATFTEGLAICRLLRAIAESETDFRLEVLTKGNHLSTRLAQASRTARLRQLGKKSGRIQNEAFWVETANLWDACLAAGIREALTPQEVAELTAAKEIAVWQRDLLRSDETTTLDVDDGRLLDFALGEDATRTVSP